MIMNNTFKYIITKVAFIFAALLFGSTAFAQDGAVHYDKRVTPDPDPNGVYTISLEAYVTGSVTVTTETKPADIILALDYSSSMRDDINNLRKAVATFVNTIKESNETVVKDENGGHRIGFVLFDGNVYTNSSNLNTLLDVDELTATVTSNSGQVRDNTNTDLIGFNIGSGTGSYEAIAMADTMLLHAFKAGDYTDTDRSRTVVMFTDGEPYSPSFDRDQRRSMTGCIDAANRIKNSASYPASIYTVGLFTGHNTADEVTTYMNFTSSDNKTETMAWENRGTPRWPNWVLINPETPVNVTGTYSIIVSNSSALASIFDSIASSSGGEYSASSASSVLIDVVATSFAIPVDADLGSVKVYKVPAVKPSKEAILTFNESAAVEITDQVGLTTPQSEGGKENEVQVTGFDYGAEWCGYDEEHNTSHGHKLVLTIPITVNDDAVGGPHVNTNTTDSKLIIKDSDGKVISENVFPRPYLKIPVNLWIQKTGLLEDDSAVFNLRRTPYLGPDVDYTASTIVWEDWGEKVVCNAQTMNEDGIVKVSGLSPDYVYKIYEDAWGALGYIYQDDDTLYSVGSDAKNPFVFANTPKKVVFDEATVRNVFKKKEKATDAK